MITKDDIEGGLLIIRIITWIFLANQIDHFTDSVRRIADEYSGKDEE